MKMTTHDVTVGDVSQKFVIKLCDNSPNLIGNAEGTQVIPSLHIFRFRSSSPVPFRNGGVGDQGLEGRVDTPSILTLFVKRPQKVGLVGDSQSAGIGGRRCDIGWEEVDIGGGSGRYWTGGTGYWGEEGEYWMPVTEYWMSAARYWIGDRRYWTGLPVIERVCGVFIGLRHFS